VNGDAVRRGELAGDAACLDSWHPYVAVGPARQSSACPTARNGAPVAWTAPFPLWFALSRVRRLLRVAAATTASSRARVSASPAKRLRPVLR